jgi:hypothetical protein
MTPTGHAAFGGQNQLETKTKGQKYSKQCQSEHYNTVIKHAFGRHKSPAWRFRSGSRLGRRTSRSGMRPVHDLR